MRGLYLFDCPNLSYLLFRSSHIRSYGTLPSAVMIAPWHRRRFVKGARDEFYLIDGDIIVIIHNAEDCKHLLAPLLFN